MATPQEILDEFRCETSCYGSSTFEVLEIGILKNILTQLGSPMTQEEINAQVGCWSCYGMSLNQSQVLVLLNALATAAGNIVGSIVGSGSPEGVVTADPGALYVDITNHTFWIKETGVGNTGWIQFV